MAGTSVRRLKRVDKPPYLIRFCKHCTREAEFTRGSASRCRQCSIAKVRAWRAANPEKYEALKRRNNSQKERRRAALLEARYGITVADYEHMYGAQAGRCKVCSLASEVLDVDHDHATGTVRGLLCRSCNLAIGLLADDPRRVRALVAYLEEESCPAHFMA